MRYLRNMPFQIVCLLLAVLMGMSIRDRAGHPAFAGDLLVAYQKLNGEHDQLKLSRITRFGWDRMFVFPPSTPLTEISKILGAPVPAAILKTGIEQREDINLLVFLNGQSIVEVSPVPRTGVDFLVGMVGISLDTNNAVFAKASSGKLLALAELKE